MVTSLLPSVAGLSCMVFAWEVVWLAGVVVVALPAFGWEAGCCGTSGSDSTNSVPFSVTTGSTGSGSSGKSNSASTTTPAATANQTFLLMDFFVGVAADTGAARLDAAGAAASGAFGFGAFPTITVFSSSSESTTGWSSRRFRNTSTVCGRSLRRGCIAQRIAFQVRSDRLAGRSSPSSFTMEASGGTDPVSK